MECGCSWPGGPNSADHLPAEFIALPESGAPLSVDDRAEGHARIRSNLVEPAVAANSLVAAALAGRPPVASRHGLLPAPSVLAAPSYGGRPPGERGLPAFTRLRHP
ncbi:hypothetical protein ACFXA3_23545 [Streptomyces sp. NPDC059456]|uniref:hypothetical protein n=1 Tax=Streptomyces sp. NPDC059456 TaxID=3346838 RepID=UPI0036C0B885